jgi:hypothetical protein
MLQTHFWGFSTFCETINLSGTPSGKWLLVEVGERPTVHVQKKMMILACCCRGLKFLFISNVSEIKSSIKCQLPCPVHDNYLVLFLISVSLRYAQNFILGISTICLR